ncbi:hypothetical protein F5887DRAFT_870979, partial [Amanita rubescens]
VFLSYLLDVAEKNKAFRSTFFVSNLPYNATSTDLQTLFSEIAPVRNAFVVCESGTGMSKGVGYVSFAIRKDAQAAFDQIAKEGLTLVGRKLRIQWAEQKMHEIDLHTKIRKHKGAEKLKPQLPQTDVGTTLFIRNIPYDATENELRVLFHTFGPLRYVRVTMDPATGRTRGTGFACFWNKEDADKIIQQSQLLKAETTGTDAVFLAHYPLISKIHSHSILTPDPSSSLAQNLVLHGRALDVIRAVMRDEAGRLKELGERAREKADKRKMYLLREGVFSLYFIYDSDTCVVILSSSPSAATIPPSDLERRTNSFNARRALLKSNSSLYVSKTRPSIRQIPLFVTERMLKRLAR